MSTTVTTEQGNFFPIFFTLEHVNNGYILTAKEDNGGMKKATYQKEVVMENDIDERIGRLLRLSALKKDKPVVFHVETAAEGTYQFGDDLPGDALADAKLAYVHFNSRHYTDGSVVALHVKDSDTIEVWGADAEKASGNNGIPLTRVGGIPMLTFPNTKEGRNSLSACFSQIKLNPTSHDELQKWYQSRKVQLEEKKPLKKG